MSDEQGILHEQFDDLEQQHDANTMGMWIFLATEVLLFGALFMGFTAYRITFTRAFDLASKDTIYWIGTLNTGVLLTSSLFMALSVHAVHRGNRKALVVYLLLTLLLGLTFLGLKGLEYYQDYLNGSVPHVRFDWKYGTQANAHHGELFWMFYFFMTGLHAVHLTVGCGLVTIIAFLSWRGKFTPQNYSPVELTGLYWHFVDIVWVFLYPLLYLSGRAG